MPNTSLGLTYPDGTGSSQIWTHVQELASDTNTYLTAQQTKYETIRGTDGAAATAVFASVATTLPRAGTLLVVGVFRWQSSATANLFAGLAIGGTTFATISFAALAAKTEDQILTLVGITAASGSVTVESSMTASAGTVTARAGSYVNMVLL